MENGFSIFTGTANPKLARKIAKQLDISLGSIDTERFPDGEVSVRYDQNIRGRDVFLVQPFCPPDQDKHIMELLVMIDAAKRASAKSITPVVPYYGYARQDRKDKSRVPITAKLVADIMTAAGIDRILTMDLHAPQIEGFFNVPVNHLYAASSIVSYLKNRIDCKDLVIVAPDIGGKQMLETYVEYFSADFAVVYKKRDSATKVEAASLAGDVEGRNCLIVDDITATAGTIIAAANKLKDSGANKIYAVVTHCCLDEVGYKNIENSPLEFLVTTDTIPSVRKPKIRVASISKLVAEAIQRIYDGRSISSLFLLDKDEDE
jgi:ribose-phosphate pyrophosphokinase